MSAIKKLGSSILGSNTDEASDSEDSKMLAKGGLHNDLFNNYYNNGVIDLVSMEFSLRDLPSILPCSNVVDFVVECDFSRSIELLWYLMKAYGQKRIKIHKHVKNGSRNYLVIAISPRPHMALRSHIAQKSPQYSNQKHL